MNKLIRLFCFLVLISTALMNTYFKYNYFCDADNLKSLSNQQEGTLSAESWKMSFDNDTKKENREFDNGVYKAKYATLEDFEKQNSLLVKDIETCPAFNPELSESEYDNKYLDIIKEACKSYPEVALKDIYANLSRKYGKEFKNYKFFTKYVNKKKIVDTKKKKRLI